MFDQFEYHFPSQKLRLSSGLEINYIDEGRGEQILLFIHGLANYADVWWQQVAVLRKYFRCIAVDLPGCGKSSRGDYPYSMVFFSEVIKDFIETKKLSDVVLCGHSMGGQVAIISCLRFPSLINKLILCAPAGFEKYNPTEIRIYKSMLSMGQFFFNNETQLVQSLKHSFYQMSDKGQSMIKSLTDILHKDDVRQWRVMVEKCIHGMLEEQIFDLLKFIQCPALVLYGEKDQLIPNVYFHPESTKSMAEKAMKEVHDAKLVMIPLCGHFVFYEKPDRINEEIVSFLDQNY